MRSKKRIPTYSTCCCRCSRRGSSRTQLGHTVSFRNTVLIMTSNAGAREISSDTSLGFQVAPGGKQFSEIRSHVLAEMKRLFSPEFLNRIDESVVFHPLSKAQLELILELELNEVRARLGAQQISLEVRKDACEYLMEKGYDPKVRCAAAAPGAAEGYRGSPVPGHPQGQIPARKHRDRVCQGGQIAVPPPPPQQQQAPLRQPFGRVGRSR